MLSFVRHSVHCPPGNAPGHGRRCLLWPPAPVTIRHAFHLLLAAHRHPAQPLPGKFGIPRQPGLAPHALATVTLLPPYNQIDSVRGLDSFSHVWLIFAFHQTAGHGWRPTVRPPRLGGNARVGVFASRSTFRPNPLGLSVAELLGIDSEHGVVLRLRGVDLLDGTPILDIKPYIPFVDSQPQARGGFVDGPPATLAVEWSAAAAAAVQRHQAQHPELATLIEEVLGARPTPGLPG